MIYCKISLQFYRLSFFKYHVKDHLGQVFFLEEASLEFKSKEYNITYAGLLIISKLENYDNIDLCSLLNDQHFPPTFGMFEYLKVCSVLNGNIVTFCLQNKVLKLPFAKYEVESTTMQLSFECPHSQVSSVDLKVSRNRHIQHITII